MKNILLRKKKYFWPGGITNTYNTTTNSWNFGKLQQPNFNDNLLSNSNQNSKYGLNEDFSKMDNIQSFQNRTGVDLGKSSNDNILSKTKAGSDIAGKIGGYAQIAEAGIGGAINGSNNWDKGKVQTQEGQFKFAENQANDVSQTYSAGQTKLNTLSRTGAAASAKDLKTHKGWKNILGSTASGAMAGASVGGIWGAAIGGAVGLIGSSIGEIFGARKRKREAEKLAEQKKAADYAIDYFNSRQAEQLASANDNAAKVQAQQNRQSVLALAAYGGRLKRNYLLSKRNF